MAYKLEISAYVAHQIDTCIRYIVDTLQNPSAAKAILEDIACAYEQLEERAESVAFCEDPYLHAKGYRKLALKRVYLPSRKENGVSCGVLPYAGELPYEAVIGRMYSPMQGAYLEYGK